MGAALDQTSGVFRVCMTCAWWVGPEKKKDLAGDCHLIPVEGGEKKKQGRGWRWESVWIKRCGSDWCSQWTRKS